MASIEEQIKKIVAKKAKLANGKTIEQTLMEAVDYLYGCIQGEIDFMYDSYEPIKYKRRPHGENLKSALYVEDFMNARIKGNRIELSLKFSDKVWAWNFDHTHKSNVAVLMSQGWAWKNQPEEPVWRFTYFEGYDFIRKGIQKFNATNHWGMHISEDDIHIDDSNWY